MDVPKSDGTSGDGDGMVMVSWLWSARKEDEVNNQWMCCGGRRSAKGETQVSGVQFVRSYSRVAPNQGEGGPDPGPPAGNLTCLVLG